MVQDESTVTMTQQDKWLLVKRGLYYRPDDVGYTSIRAAAGVYSGDEARARLSPGIAMVALEHAPEFSDACFDDLARAHLAKERDEARAEIERLRAEGTMLAQAILEAIEAIERGSTSAPVSECLKAALRRLMPAHEQITPDEASMRAFGASDAACYKWPDDTPEHKALRAAYIEGAADCGGKE